MANISVAVIGGGAAGLCAARHLSAASSVSSSSSSPRQVRIKVFEQTGGIGGTWVYSDSTGHDSNGLPVHSSMYKHLKTNLPKEVMAFPDFPFPDYEESFIPHSKVLDYLQQYCDHFQLEKFIKFNTHITRVLPIVQQNNPAATKWQVTSKCLRTSAESEEMFDSVMVCNGHYSVPVTPNIPGLDTWPGHVIHSHNYREPHVYRGKRVVILGGGASGTDISMELSDFASEVYLSHNNPPLPTVLPSNVHQVKGIVRCLSSGAVQLVDQSEIEVDVILLATGYHYSFPFLTDECGVTVTTRRVTPLFKHLVNINHPSMCFIGIPIQICPFPQFDLQVRYFVKLITGQLETPSKDLMMQDMKQEEEWRRTELGLPDKYFHKMGTLQWKYNKEIAALGQIEPIPDAVENLYNAVHERRRYHLPSYKKDNYKIVGPDSYTSKLADNDVNNENKKSSLGYFIV